MNPVGAVNLAVRFLVAELGALVALGLWAFDAFDGVATVLVAVVAIGTAVGLWAVFVAPKASQRLSDPARFALELGIFAAATAALVAVAGITLAVVYAAMAVASAALVRIWPEPTAPPR